MFKYLTLVFFAIAVRAMAADGVAVFQQDLQAFATNGPEALVHSWYDPSEKEKIASISDKLAKETQ